LINYYEILEIEQGASAEEIEQTIIREINRWRQRVNAPSPERQREAQERLDILHKAQEVLLDEAKRVAYDEQLIQSQTEQTEEPQAQEDTETEEDRRFKELTERLNYFFDNKSYADAIVVAKELINIQPDNPFIWYDLALANFNWDNFSDARYEIEHAISLRVNDASFYHLAHVVFYDSPDLPADQRRIKGREFIQKALELDPDNPRYNANYANLLLNEGNYQEAIRRLERFDSEQQLDDYGSNVLARCYADKIIQEYTTHVHIGNGEYRHFFVDQALTEEAKYYLDRAKQLAKTNELRGYLSEIEREYNFANKKHYNYKYLAVIIIGVLLFLGNLNSMGLFPFLLFGGMIAYGYYRFAEPGYRANKRTIKTLQK